MVSKRQAAERPTPVVPAKRRRAESVDTTRPESMPAAPSTSQFSPTELTTVISQANSGALQSAQIINAGPTPSASEPDMSAQEPTLVEDAASKEIADLINTPGRLIFPSDKPHERFSSVTFDLDSRLSDRIKAKMWANRYVDFGSLLTVTPDESKYWISNDHDNPSLCLKDVKPKRRNLSILTNHC